MDIGRSKSSRDGKCVSGTSCGAGGGEVGHRGGVEIQVHVHAQEAMMEGLVVVGKDSCGGLVGSAEVPRPYPSSTVQRCQGHVPKLTGHCTPAK